MFIVVGEALVDLVGQRGSRTFVAHPGGSPANVALGLARLGHPVTLVTRLGADPFGEMVTSHLQASGVRVDADTRPGDRTSLAMATLAAGSATYDFRIEWDIGDLVPLSDETRCLHTGSLATALAPGSGRVVELLERERRQGRATISYDPNVRPALLGAPEQARPGIEDVVGLSDVVKVSDEDLAWLYPGRADEDIAHDWLDAGPGLVVVTRGAAGVLAVSARGMVEQPARPIELVDTVGAGDSFTAGLLDGLAGADLLGGTRRRALAAVDDPTLRSLLDEASRVAAITCSRPGADPPAKAELDAGQLGRSDKSGDRT